MNMIKEKIPVYDICNLTGNPARESEFLAERFGSYLKRHATSLHFPHRHNFYHLVLFIKGAGYHTIDFTQFKVRPFEIYFMIPGQVHSWQFEGETDGYIINFSENLFRSFLLNPNWFEKFSFFSGLSEDGVLKISANIKSKVIQLFEEILELTTKENGQDLIRLLVLQIFTLLEQTVNGTNKKAIPAAKQVLFRNFRRLIDQYYKTTRLPKEYAGLLYITPNHLNALCRDVSGKSAGELIRDRVLLEAKRLLTNAGMTITEIAYNLDFQDNSYFTRFFKKSTGSTPDEFRKQLIIPKIKAHAHTSKSKK